MQCSVPQRAQKLAAVNQKNIHCFRSPSKPTWQPRDEGISILTFWTFQLSKPWQKLSEPIHDNYRYIIQIHCTRITELAMKPMKCPPGQLHEYKIAKELEQWACEVQWHFQKWQGLLNHAQEDLIVMHSMCSCLENFTLVTKPMASKLRIAHWVMSSCHHFSPWCGEYSKAWWLLCHSSPNEINATHLKIRLTTYGGKWTSSQMHVMISSSHQTKDCFKLATK